MSDFKNAVQKMRDSQKAYFKNRDAKDLQDAKFWERRVDSMLNENTDQTELFN